MHLFYEAVKHSEYLVLVDTTQNKIYIFERNLIFTKREGVGLKLIENPAIHPWRVLLSCGGCNEEKLSQFAPRRMYSGSGQGNRMTNRDERYLLVEWIDIGAQWITSRS